MSIKRVAALAAFAGSILFVHGADAQSPGLKAGTWLGQTVNKFSGPLASNPLAALLMKPIVSRKCISPEVAKRGLVSFVTGDSNCRLERPEISASQLRADKICRDSDGKELASRMVVDFTAEHLSIKDSTVINGSPFEMTATADWVGPSCLGAEE